MTRPLSKNRTTTTRSSSSEAGRKHDFTPGGVCKACGTRAHWDGASKPCTMPASKTLAARRDERTAIARRIATRRAVFSPRLLSILQGTMAAMLEKTDDPELRAELENAIIWADQEAVALRARKGKAENA